MGRSPCCAKVGLNRGAWTAEEDTLLTNFIRTHGEGGWRSLPKKAGLRRCGKSCRLRWLNYLRPNIKRGNISPDEEDLIIRLHALLGNRWSIIAGRVPGRTDNEIKNYWNTYLSKKLAARGIDPKTHKLLADKNPVRSPHRHGKQFQGTVNTEKQPILAKIYDLKLADKSKVHRSGKIHACKSLSSSSLVDNHSVLNMSCGNGMIDSKIDHAESISLTHDLDSPSSELRNISRPDHLHCSLVPQLNASDLQPVCSDGLQTDNDLQVISISVINREAFLDQNPSTQTLDTLLDSQCPNSEDNMLNANSPTLLDHRAPQTKHDQERAEFTDVISFFEVGEAENEICCNRMETEWMHEDQIYLKEQSSLDGMDYDPLQEKIASCNNIDDYVNDIGTIWEASLWN